jgi:iron donor protein CyaY
MTDQEFRDRADSALKGLEKALLRAGDRHGFEADSHQGALTVEFEDPPAKFVVSPNAPVRQIWVSARVKSFKLDWDQGRGVFVLTGDGRDLKELLADLAGEQLGTPVVL